MEDSSATGSLQPTSDVCGAMQSDTSKRSARILQKHLGATWCTSRMRGHNGMKRLMEEVAARHAKAIHYSASAGIRVGSDGGQKTKDSGFWPSVLEGLSGLRLTKEEADGAEKRVREVIEWYDLVEENTGFLQAACKNYEVLVVDKQAGKGGGGETSNRYETWSALKRNDVGGFVGRLPVRLRNREGNKLAESP